jgi:hypothetical protein
MPKNTEATLRESLQRALRGEESHIEFAAAIKDFPFAEAGAKPAGAPHSAWELLEHLRIAQSDILEFSRDPKHKSPKFPDGYWPKATAPTDEKAWQKSIAAFQDDAKAFQSLLAGESHDLYAAIEGGDGQTLLREALVLACHHSYHLGQFMFLKKMLVAGS